MVSRRGPRILPVVPRDPFAGVDEIKGGLRKRDQRDYEHDVGAGLGSDDVHTGQHGERGAAGNNGRDELGCVSDVTSVRSSDEPGMSGQSRPDALPRTPGDTGEMLSRRAIAAIASVAILVPGCGGDDVSGEERDQAITAAKSAYKDAVARGENLEAGPCIAENLPDLPDWVADVAHDPRQDIDDESQNQCRRYRDGDASHFVELTPDGELIKAE